MNRWADVTPEQMRDAARCGSLTEALTFLGFGTSGEGTRLAFRQRAQLLNLDVSHWSTRKNSVGRLTGVNRRPGYVLAQLLLDAGVPMECAKCKLGRMWNGLPTCFDVDHINGDWRDCRVENLRFLCPNCHKQQPTSSSGYVIEWARRHGVKFDDIFAEKNTESAKNSEEGVSTA